MKNSARQLREDTKGVWGDENYSSKEKRERTIELRNKWIAGIQQITVSDKTIYHILAHLEEDYSDIERHLFLLMMDGEIKSKTTYSILILNYLSINFNSLRL